MQLLVMPMIRQEFLLGGSNNSTGSNSSNGSCGSNKSSRSRSLHKSIVKAVLKGLHRHSKHGDHSYKALGGKAQAVPKGYLAVYVGEISPSSGSEEGMERFLVKTEHLHHPIFMALLRRSEEEFNFCNKGALLIPCKVELFQLLLCHIENDDTVPDSSQAEELIRLYTLSFRDGAALE